jgi:hypothetical protein
MKMDPRFSAWGKLLAGATSFSATSSAVPLSASKDAGF